MHNVRWSDTSPVHARPNSISLRAMRFFELGHNPPRTASIWGRCLLRSVWYAAHLRDTVKCSAAWFGVSAGVPPPLAIRQRCASVYGSCLSFKRGSSCSHTNCPPDHSQTAPRGGEGQGRDAKFATWLGRGDSCSIQENAHGRLVNRTPPADLLPAPHSSAFT